MTVVHLSTTEALIIRDNTERRYALPYPNRDASWNRLELLLYDSGQFCKLPGAARRLTKHSDEKWKETAFGLIERKRAQ